MFMFSHKLAGDELGDPAVPCPVISFSRPSLRTTRRVHLDLAIYINNHAESKVRVILERFWINSAKLAHTTFLDQISQQQNPIL